MAHRHGEPSLRHCARVIEKSVEHVLSNRIAIPMEYGGAAGTGAMTSAVIAALPRVLELAAA